MKQAKQDFAADPAGYRMLGDFYVSVGDLDKASDEYSSLAHDHPDDWQVKKNYTQLLIAKNRLEEARKIDDEVLKSFPNDSDALIDRAQIQTRQGHPNDAVTTLRTVIKNDPENALAHDQLGLGLEQLGYLDQAQTEWQEALRLHPAMDDAERSLAALALRTGNMGALEQTANHIIQQHPGSAEGYVMRALSLIRRGQFASAEQDIRKAVSLAPEDAAPYIQMGNLKLAEKQPSAAEKAYHDALERSPSSADALAGLMHTFLLEKQPDQAVAAANAQIAKVPTSGAFYDLLGTALFLNKQDLRGAEAALSRAVELDKNNADAVVRLGQVQLARGSAADAIATYQRALRDNPRQVTLDILLGELYDRQHDFDQAKAAYQKALELDSNNALASNNLAYLLLENGGNVDEAVSLAQTARRGAPDSPGVADTLGWALYRKGYYQQSIDLFQEALRLAAKGSGPDNPNLHYHLGLAYQKAGHPEQAKKELERVLQLNPNYVNAVEVKKVLTALHS
jgi:tetratricopeptide (TPR) repeat protein